MTSKARLINALNSVINDIVTFPGVFDADSEIVAIARTAIAEAEKDGNEQIDHLIAARNAITDRTDEYINQRAVDHIDAVLRDVQPSQRADVDALLGRKRVVMVKHADGAVEAAPGFDVTPAEMKRIAEDAWRNQPPIEY